MSKLSGHKNITKQTVDVASIYIKLVKEKSGSAVEQALKRHKKLVTLLVSILDSGYTTGSEESLIQYLQH